MSAEKPSSPGKTEKAQVCLSCGVNSQRRTLLPCVVKGEEKWVCVRCLPMLIHGSE